MFNSGTYSSHSSPSYWKLPFVTNISLLVIFTMCMSGSQIRTDSQSKASWQTTSTLFESSKITIPQLWHEPKTKIKHSGVSQVHIRSWSSDSLASGGERFSSCPIPFSSSFYLNTFTDSISFFSLKNGILYSFSPMLHPDKSLIQPFQPFRLSSLLPHVLHTRISYHPLLWQIKLLSDVDNVVLYRRNLWDT